MCSSQGMYRTCSLRLSPTKLLQSYNRSRKCSASSRSSGTTLQVCGAQHRQVVRTNVIPFEQNEYAAPLRCIAHAELNGKKAEEPVGSQLHSLYDSLLKAVSFLLLTRIDVAVCVSARQRWGHAPKDYARQAIDYMYKVDTGEPDMPSARGLPGAGRPAGRARRSSTRVCGRGLQDGGANWTLYARRRILVVSRRV